MKCFIAPAALLVALFFHSAAAYGAIPPTQKLLPATTKGYVSVPSVDALIEAFNKTQFGELVHDPIMEPFVDDLKTQLQAKFKQNGQRLGLQLEDLEGVYGGEVALASIQPDGDKKLSAILMIVDITGKQSEAKKLIERVTADLVARGAKQTAITLGGSAATQLMLPKKATETIQRYAFYIIAGDMLLIGDHQPTMDLVLKNAAAGGATDSLESLGAYKSIMTRCTQAAGNDAAHAKWFVEPFGYVDVMRAANGGKRRRGKDLAKILSEQGFGVVKGIGGVVALNQGEADVIHNTFIYAPATEGVERLVKAAKVLDFPNGKELSPPDWIPQSVGSYLTLNWRVKEAFEASKSLVDAMFDDVFETTLDGLKNDPDGPQVDIRSNLVAHLGDRITLLTDNQLPIDIKSERLLFAIEVTRPDVVKLTVDKMMKVDPAAKPVKLDNGETIWEIINDHDVMVVKDLEIDGPEVLEDTEESQDEDAPRLPNSAVGVINGHLFIASHVDFIKEVSANFEKKESVAAQADYQAIHEFLGRMSAGEHSLRAFSRTSTTYHGAYELIRQGKMPQGETLLASALNKVFGEDEDGVERKQQIDGSKLPEFSKVAKYFGDAGFTMTTEADGWIVSGCLLRKKD